MAADDRKQRIQEHLKATSGNKSLFSIKKTRQAPQSPQSFSFASVPTKETQPPVEVTPPPQAAPAQEKAQPFEAAAPAQEKAQAVETAASQAEAPRSVATKPKTFSQQDFRKKNVMDHVKKTSVNFGDFSLGSKERQQQILEHLRKSQG